jgi:signal transduction histidine kinase
MKILTRYWNQFLHFITKRVEDFGAQYRLFGIFGAVNYFASYVILKYILPQPNPGFWWRLVATLMCIPLILPDKWPQSLRRYLPLYWYLTLIYTLPLFGTYMLFSNHFTTDWLINMALGLFLFVLLVDWLSFISLLTIGVTLGWLCFYLSGNQYPMVDLETIYLAVYTYIFAIIIGALFSQNKQRLDKERLVVTKAIGANIAHEIRTPLASVNSAITGIERYFPQLLRGYMQAKTANLIDNPIPIFHYELLGTLVDDIRAETKYANTVIDMLLSSSSHDKNEFLPDKIYSIETCIQAALERYPFTSNEELNLIECEITEFLFRGEEILVIHVLFNLIKNALYFIKAEGKGKIYITTRTSNKGNYLFFKDTAKGLSSKVKSRVFERFYTTTEKGTGLGLSFCKAVIVNLGGTMTVNSQEGEYTEFIIQFPKT